MAGTSNPELTARLRRLPAIHLLTSSPEARELEAVHGHRAVADAARALTNAARAEVMAGGEPPLPSQLIRGLAHTVQKQVQPHLRRVINATGVVLHTNLGRAPLAQAAIDALLTAAGACNLELDLETGLRGSRQAGVAPLIAQLLGAPAGTAVNNCAAATVIALRALCRGREVIVSRGQLVEIGGSFRLPEIFEVSGARLREVGCTNISRVEDYQRAIGPETAAIMRVHPSNYRVEGFTHSPSVADLAPVAKNAGILLLDDVGSGAVADMGLCGLPGEPGPADGLNAGADLTLCSADKLLGGPQAGLIAGRADLVEKIRKDPLFRAMRLDKLVLAALEATLRIHLDSERAWREIPVLALLRASLEGLLCRAEVLASQLRTLAWVASADVRQEKTLVGGGSLPGMELPTAVVAIEPRGISVDEAAKTLRLAALPVLVRRKDDRILIDLRSVVPTDDAALLEALKSVSFNLQNILD